MEGVALNGVHSTPGGDKNQSALRARLGKMIAGYQYPTAAATDGLEEFDAIVSHIEVTQQHGVGALLKQLFGTAPQILSIRSQDQFGGTQQFGDHSVRLHHGKASRPAVYASVAALGDGRVRRVLVCPYFPDDVKTAIAVADVHGAPMCTWLMDDQNVVESGIPDSLMRELLERSHVRFAISGQMRDAYEAKYGLPFNVLPPTVSSHLVQVVAHEPSPGSLIAGRGAIIGNIWGAHWLDLLRRALNSSGLRLDWFCNSGPKWLPTSEAELAQDGLIVRGSIPSDLQLKRELQSRPFAVVPTGTLEELDDRRAIAALSLPSRIIFSVAAANTPVLVLGSRQTGASQFVEAFGLGTTAAYETNEILEAMAYLLNDETQTLIRRRAAELAPSFSSAGVRDWLWRSLRAGRPFDRRFEDIFPRSPAKPIEGEKYGAIIREM